MADEKKIKTRVTNSGLNFPGKIARETVIIDGDEYEVDENIELTQDQIDRLKAAGVKFGDPKPESTTNALTGGENQ